MGKIIQVIPAVTNLYAVWEAGTGADKWYGVDRAYYLGLDDGGDVYPLIIDERGLIDTFSYDELKVFDWDGYQMWKLYEAKFPVYEQFNMFEKEQKEKGIEFL